MSCSLYSCQTPLSTCWDNTDITRDVFMGAGAPTAPAAALPPPPGLLLLLWIAYMHWYYREPKSRIFEKSIIFGKA